MVVAITVHRLKQGARTVMMAEWLGFKYTYADSATQFVCCTYFVWPWALLGEST